MLLVQSKVAKKNCVTEIIEIIVDNNGTAFANSAKSQKLNFSPGQLWMAMTENGPKPKNRNEIDASLPNAWIKILAPPNLWIPVMLGTPSSWGCKEAGMVSVKECYGFREDGAVEEAGENDT